MAKGHHPNQRSNLERLLRTAWENQQRLQARTTMMEESDKPIERASKEKSLLRKFLDWEGISFVTLSLTGLTFLTISHGYRVSRICFIGAAAALAIKLSFNVTATFWPRVTIAILSSIVGGIAVNKVNVWVDSLEIEEVSKPPVQTILVTRKTSSERASVSAAQMEEIKDLSRFIGEPDEASLRNEFGIPEMMNTNIRGIINNLHRYRRTGQLHHYVLPPGEALIDSRFAQGHIRRQGGAFLVDYDDTTVFFILLPKDHVTAVAHLKKLENSSELPKPILKRVKEFDETISQNNTHLIEVLSGAMTTNKDYFYEYDDPHSPFFHALDALYLDSFVQLRPKADKVKDAIRGFLAIN